MKKIFLLVLILLVSVSLFGCQKPQPPVSDSNTVPPAPTENTNNTIVYSNTQYGFNFSLPKSWQGYSLVTAQWEGRALGGSQEGQVVEKGALLSIRHPQWTTEKPRQDIPIMIFTPSQWNLVQQEKLSVGAAPIGPRELGRNTSYVFALPARYNFAFPIGFEEVEDILASNPLQVN